jgi:hypothetical protein
MLDAKVSLRDACSLAVSRFEVLMDKRKACLWVLFRAGWMGGKV